MNINVTQSNSSSTYTFETAGTYVDENISLTVNVEGDSVADHTVTTGVNSSAGWVWKKTVYSNRTEYEAWAVDTTNFTSGNSSFTTGLYYKDNTKSLLGLFTDLGVSAPNSMMVQVTTNGNSGSGYVIPWRSAYSKANNNIAVRLVSSSSSAMGTLTTSYFIKWYE